MTELQERREEPRTGLAERPPARVRGLREVRLLDLSPTGAQIEHLDLFRLGASCAIDLPPPCGALGVPARVIWCTVIGRKRKLGGDSHLVARSGLRFTNLSSTQHATLADTVQFLATAMQPIA